jgi:hypothetical protein
MLDLFGSNTVMTLNITPDVAASLLPNSKDVMRVVAEGQSGPQGVASTVVAELSPVEMDLLKRCFSEFQSLATRIIAVLQQSADLINKKKISTGVWESADIREWLVKAQSIINQFSAQSCVPFDATNVMKRLRAVKLVADMVLAAFKSNFAQKDDLTYSILNAYAPLRQPSCKVVVIMYEKAGKSVVQLERYVESQGRSWLREAYIGSVEWARRYSIVPLAIGAVSSAALVGAGLYTVNLDPNSRFSKLQHDMRERLGGFPDWDKLDRGLRIMANLNTVIGLVGTIGGFLLKPVVEGLKSFDANMRDEQYRPPNQMEQVDETITMNDPRIQVIKGQLAPFFQILDLLENPETSAHVPIPKSILITGPSGCSKTFSVNAFCGSLSEILRKLGIPFRAGFRTIDLTELAKATDPCSKLEEIFKECSSQGIYVVLWWDELHSAQLQVSGNSHILTKLLTILQDKALRRSSDKCIFIAATNRFELLDVALKRRWDRIIYMSLPDLRQRAGAISAIAQTKAIALQEQEIMRLACATNEVSFGGLDKMFEEATRLASKAGSAVTFEYLYKAINQAVRQLEERIMLSVDEEHLLAVGLAAQALFYLYADEIYGSPVLFESMTLLSEPNKIKEQYDFMTKYEGRDIAQTYQVKPGAFYTYRKDEHILTRSVKEPFVSCMGHLVRAAATEKILGIIIASEDGTAEAYDEALRILVGVKELRELPDTLKKLPKEVQIKFKTQAWFEVGRCKKVVAQFVEAQREKILKVAERLKQDRFMRFEQVQSLLAGPAPQVSRSLMGAQSKQITGVFPRELALFAKSGAAPEPQ